MHDLLGTPSTEPYFLIELHLHFHQWTLSCRAPSKSHYLFDVLQDLCPSLPAPFSAKASAELSCISFLSCSNLCCSFFFLVIAFRNMWWLRPCLTIFKSYIYIFTCDHLTGLEYFCKQRINLHIEISFIHDAIYSFFECMSDESIKLFIFEIVSCMLVMKS